MALPSHEQATLDALESALRREDPELDALLAGGLSALQPRRPWWRRGRRGDSAAQ